MDYYITAKREQPKKAEKKVAKEIKEKLVKLKEKPRRRQKPMKTERALPISVFKGVTDKRRKAFEKLPATEQLALLELEKIKKAAKERQAKLTEIPEASKVVPPTFDPTQELAILKERVAKQVTPLKADVARIKELEGTPVGESSTDIVKIEMKLPKNLGELKKSAQYKALSSSEQKALVDHLRTYKTRAEREKYLSELLSKPPAKVKRSIKLLERGRITPLSEVVIEEEKEGSPKPTSPKRKLPTPPVTGKGLKIPKKMMEKISKQYKHPTDQGIVYGLVKHKKVKGGSVDDVLAKLKELKLGSAIHSKTGFADKLAKAFKK